VIVIVAIEAKKITIQLSINTIVIFLRMKKRLLIQVFEKHLALLFSLGWVWFKKSKIENHHYEVRASVKQC
jgi:hypothetical protein